MPWKFVIFQKNLQIVTIQIYKDILYILKEGREYFFNR
jgi:hypothetical protein